MLVRELAQPVHLPALGPDLTISCENAAVESAASRGLRIFAPYDVACVAFLAGGPVSIQALRLTPERATLFGSLTRRDYRGRGLATLTTLTLLQQAWQRGYSQVFAATHVLNEASLQTLKKAGFQMDRGVLTMKIGPLNPGQWLDSGVCRIRNRMRSSQSTP